MRRLRSAQKAADAHDPNDVRGILKPAEPFPNPPPIDTLKL